MSVPGTQPLAQRLKARGQAAAEHRAEAKRAALLSGFAAIAGVQAVREGDAVAIRAAGLRARRFADIRFTSPALVLKGGGL